MEHLYTPWRSAYVVREEPSKRKKILSKRSCFFCANQKSKNDEQNLIVTRRQKSFVILNLYPYNDGHLLIAPYRHVGDPGALTQDEWMDLHETSREVMNVLKKTLHPEGFNLGMNLGKVAGAGFADHLHLHIVPRWLGDTNFMPILAKTKLINQDLNQLCKRLRAALK